MAKYPEKLKKRPQDNHKYKKSLGQNFLNDKNVVKRILESHGDIAGKNMLEIGTGRGALTQEILLHNPAKFVSIEKDDNLRGFWVESEKFYDNFSVVFGDALLINEAELMGREFDIIANLPYNIATGLLLKWVDLVYKQEAKIGKITVMVQKEVAERIVAKNGRNYGRLSVIMQFVFDVEFHFTIGPECFTPPPKVDSAVISLTPKSVFADVKKEDLEKFCAIFFQNRRKKIGNQLRVLFGEMDIDIDPNLRAEDVEFDNIIRLVKHFRN